MLTTIIELKVFYMHSFFVAGFPRDELHSILDTELGTAASDIEV